MKNEIIMKVNTTAADLRSVLPLQYGVRIFHFLLYLGLILFIFLYRNFRIFLHLELFYDNLLPIIFIRLLFIIIFILCLPIFIFYIIVPAVLRKNNRLYQEEQTFTFIEEKLIIQTESLQYELIWDKLERVVENKKYLAFFYSKYKFHFLPVRVIADHLQMEQIKTLIKNKVPLERYNIS